MVSQQRLIRRSRTSGDPESVVRERVHKAIGAYLSEATEGAVPSSIVLGREVLDAIMEIVVRTAINEGYFRFPGGYGSLKVQHLRSASKRLPTGEVVKLKEQRSRLRYEEGATVRELLGMPYKTSYRRKFARTSKLGDKSSTTAFPTELLDLDQSV